MVDKTGNAAFTSCVYDLIGVQRHEVMVNFVFCVVFLGPLLELSVVQHFSYVLHDKCAPAKRIRTSIQRTQTLFDLCGITFSGSGSKFCLE